MKVTIEIYPKEIKKLLELLDLIDKKPEYIYKNSSSKEKEPVPVEKHEVEEVKKSADPYSHKISDMPYESVKYNKKESLPNKELDQAVQEVVNDLSGKEKLPEASNYDELEKLINDNKSNKKVKDEDSSVIKSDNPSHAVDSNFNSNFNDFDVEQFKDDIVKFFKYTFGIDITK